MCKVSCISILNVLPICLEVWFRNPKQGRSDLQAQGQGGPGHARRVVPCSEDGQWDTLPRVLAHSRPKRVPGGNPLDVCTLLSIPTHNLIHGRLP